MGIYVLYADDFAKELMVSDHELIGKIRQTFGESSYHNDGSLNRAYLAQEAFETGRVEALNPLVHPVLWKRINELAERKEKEGVKVFAKEAAILLNNGRPNDLDYVVLLQAEKQSRIKRVQERDNTSRDKITDRITKQPDFESLTHLCDFLVLNDGGVEELEKKAYEIGDFLINL